MGWKSFAGVKENDNQCKFMVDALEISKQEDPAPCLAQHLNSWIY